MKKPSPITGIKSRTRFSKRSLQKIVKNKKATAWEKKASTFGKRFSANYENIEWISANLPIDGLLEILLDAKHPEAISRISIPVQSAFCVTCTKQDTGNYKLTWSCSMS